jgi:hypothetical protein
VGVTCDQLDEISLPASQHVTRDKPEISADYQCRHYTQLISFVPASGNQIQNKFKLKSGSDSLVIESCPKGLKKRFFWPF